MTGVVSLGPEEETQAGESNWAKTAVRPLAPDFTVDGLDTGDDTTMTYELLVQMPAGVDLSG